MAEPAAGDPRSVPGCQPSWGQRGRRGTGGRSAGAELGRAEPARLRDRAAARPAGPGVTGSDQTASTAALLGDNGAPSELLHLGRTPRKQPYVCPQGTVPSATGTEQSDLNSEERPGTCGGLEKQQQLVTYDRCKQLRRRASRCHERCPSHVFAKVQALQKNTTEILVTTARG